MRPSATYLPRRSMSRGPPNPAVGWGSGGVTRARLGARRCCTTRSTGSLRVPRHRRKVRRSGGQTFLRRAPASGMEPSGRGPFRFPGRRGTGDSNPAAWFWRPGRAPAQRPSEAVCVRELRVDRPRRGSTRFDHDAPVTVPRRRRALARTHAIARAVDGLHQRAETRPRRLTPLIGVQAASDARQVATAREARAALEPKRPADAATFVVALLHEITDG